MLYPIDHKYKQENCDHVKSYTNENCHFKKFYFRDL